MTFGTIGECYDTQENFNLKLEIGKHEESAASFINGKLFKCVVSKCGQYDRRADEVTKISIACDLALFEELTGLEGLSKLGHSCEWHFGNGRNDMGKWKNLLMKKYGFGVNVDMSWLHNGEAERNEYIDRIIMQVKQNSLNM